MKNSISASLSKIKESHLLDFLYLQIQALDAASIVAITDGKGVIKYVNEMFCKISEYSEEELIGQTHSIVNSQLHSKEFFRELWKTILTGNVWKGEIRNKKKSGGFYWVETTIIPFTDPESGNVQFVSIRNDITEKKLAEESLHDNQVRLQYSEKMASLGILSAGISHELGNPLSALSGRLEMLKRSAANGELKAEEIEANLNYCLSSIDRMNRIIRALRSYARDGSSDKFENVSLSDLITDILELTKDKSKKFDIQVELQKQGHHFCECRESEIGQVLVNLINNSIDAIKDLSTKWIKIKLEEVDDIQKITFTDSGIGICDTVAGKIFDPFFTTKPVGQGTGLGLSISCQILQGHNGSLVYNRQAPNTEFIISIPIKQH